MNVFASMLSKEIRTLGQNKSRLFYAPAFFIAITMLFPLALGPDSNSLSLFAPGLLVLAALLASLLTQEQLYKDDYKNGTLDLLAIENALLPFVTSKILLHWILSGLPLLVISPLVALMLGLPASMIVPALSHLLPMTLVLSLLGTPVAILALDSQRAGMMLAFLALPLYIPVLIFCAGGLMSVYTGTANAAPLLLLWALVAIITPLAPLVSTTLLKDKIS